MAEKVPVRKSETLFDQVLAMRERLTQRAHELFHSRGTGTGNEVDDWLAAERELLWKPALELEEREGEFVVKLAVPGVEAKQLEVQVDADRLLVRGEARKEQEETKGTVHIRELETAGVFRSLDFPKKVDPEKVKAELKSGMLTVTAKIADATAATAERKTAKPRTKKTVKVE